MASSTLLRALGEELRERRNKLGLSQEAFAHEAGVHRNVIGLVERGTDNLTIDTLIKIVAVLGVRVSDFVAAAERRR